MYVTLNQLSQSHLFAKTYMNVACYAMHKFDKHDPDITSTMFSPFQNTENEHVNKSLSSTSNEDPLN